MVVAVHVWVYLFIIRKAQALDWYPVDDCRRVMLNPVLYFLAERQEIKGRQSSLAHSHASTDYFLKVKYDFE